MPREAALGNHLGERSGWPISWEQLPAPLLNTAQSSPARVAFCPSRGTREDCRAHLAACLSQHNRFVSDCKDKEPDVLFVGDSMVQLLQQYEVRQESGEGRAIRLLL